MSFQETIKPLAGISVTLTTHAVPQNLYQLLEAIDPNCPPTCREADIQFDPIQDGAAGAVLMGDSSVTVTPQRCGFAALPGQTMTLGGGATLREVYLNNIWLVATEQDACVCNVLVQN